MWSSSPASRLGLACLATLAVFILALDDPASADRTIVAYTYVTGVGPFIGGQATPPGNVYEYQLWSDGSLVPLGTAPQTGGFFGTILTAPATLDHRLAFAYMATVGGYEVFSIDESSEATAGTLRDTGQKTGVAVGQLVLLDQRGQEGSLRLTGKHFAYVLNPSVVPQQIVEYSVDEATGLFTQLGTVPVTLGNDHLQALAISAFANVLFAEGQGTITQFTIAGDGTLTQGPTLDAPGVDIQNGCNLLTGPNGFGAIPVPGNGSSGFYSDGFGVLVAAQMGSGPEYGNTQACGSTRARLLKYNVNVLTGELSFANALQLQDAGTQDFPLELTELGDFVYASVRADNRQDNPCTCGTNLQFNLSGGDGSQVIDAQHLDHGQTGTLSNASEMTVQHWTFPVTTVCLACPTCADQTAAGSLPQWSVAIGGDPSNTFLLVGDPGIGATNRAVCIPQVESVSSPASLKVFQVADPGTGQLSQVGSLALGNGSQIPSSIVFFNPNPIVPVPPGPLAPIAIIPLDFNFPPLVPLTSASKKMKLKNEDKEPVVIDDINVDSPFMIAKDACATRTLQSGKSCKFQVVCAPTAPGTFTGSVSVNGTSAGNMLTCVATPVTLKAPATVTFTSTEAGATSRDKRIALKNPTKASVTLGTCSIPSGFAVGRSDACSNAPLGRRGKCRIAVHCAPPAMTPPGTTVDGIMECPYTYGPDPADTGNVTVALACTSK
jgi:hypothetical protein